MIGSGPKKKGIFIDNLGIIGFSILVVISLYVGHAVSSVVKPSFNDVMLIGLPLVLSGVLMLTIVYKGSKKLGE